MEENTSLQDFSRTLAVPYFSIFSNNSPKLYLILAFQIDLNASTVLFQYFQWKKKPVVPFFNVSNGKKPQPHLIFAYWTIEDPSRTLFLLFEQ